MGILRGIDMDIVRLDVFCKLGSIQKKIRQFYTTEIKAKILNLVNIEKHKIKNLIT